MTREQIMALEGRELDAAVAEHVMGWHTIRELVNTGTNRVGLYGFPPEVFGVKLVPRYSTDIAAAWQVVEHMPWSVALTNVVDGEWECTIICYDGGETHYDDETVTAPTALEAICKAALLAHFTDVRGAKNGGGAS